MSPAKWRLQFMLDATMSDAERYPLRCRDVMILSLDDYLPEVVSYDFQRERRILDLPCAGLSHDSWFHSPVSFEGNIPIDEVPGIMTLDPAAGGSDEFALAVVKVWGGNYFLLESKGFRGGTNEKMWTEIASIAKRYKVNTIGVETNFGGLEIYAQTLKPYLLKIDHPCQVIPIRSNARKELRIIDTLAPIFQNHRFIIDRRVIERDVALAREAVDDSELSYSLVYQWTRLTEDRGSLSRDDKVDALAMAVAFFQEQAALDDKKQAGVRANELFMAMIEDDLGYTLMSPDRIAMGFTIEQARKAATSNNSGASWLGKRKR
jgi:hypothetical protein